jgi:hypothetical protein
LFVARSQAIFAAVVTAAPARKGAIAAAEAIQTVAARRLAAAKPAPVANPIPMDSFAVWRTASSPVILPRFHFRALEHP